MAYIKGHSKNDSGQSSATTIDISLPEHQADDYIVLIIGQEGGGATFSSTGYTVVENVGTVGGANNSSALMYKKATSSSESDPTISSTRKDQLSVICFIVVDADTTTFIDTSDSSSNSSGSISVPSITTTTDDCLLISWYSHRNSNDLQWTVSGATYNSVAGYLPLYAKTHSKDSSGVVASETLHTATSSGKSAGIVAIRNKVGGLPPHSITGGQDYILRGGRASTISGLAALSTRVTTIDSTNVQTAISLSSAPYLDTSGLGNTATRFSSVPSASISRYEWTGYVFQLSSADFSDPETFFSFKRVNLQYNFTTRFSWYVEDSLGAWVVKEYLPVGEGPLEDDPYTFFGDFKSLPEVDSSGVIDYTDITYFGIAWIPAITNSSIRSVELWHLGRDSAVIFTGGRIDTRFVGQQSSYDSKYLRSFSQGKAQDIVSQSIQIGDGTRQTIFTATGGSFEYLDADDAHFNPTVNALSLSLYGSDDCRFNFDQSLFVNPQRQRFEINPSSSLLADYSFVSTIFDNYSVTWLSGVDCVGASFINCDQMDGKAAFFNQTSFRNSSPDTATSALKINVGAGVIACNFEKGSENYAVEIQDAGSYDFSETIFSGYTTDLNITATTGTVTIVRALGDSTPTYTTAGATVEITLPVSSITFNNLVASNVLIVDDVGTVQSYQTNQTGSYAFEIPGGAFGTWSYCVNREGYEPLLVDFSPINSTVNVNLRQKLQPSGAAMYIGSSSALLNVVIDKATPQMFIDIANGTVAVQQVFDEVEDALMTQDGMEYLVNGGGEVSIALLATGTFLFMEDDVRLRRESATDSSATVEAFVTSTQGIILDNTNGDVQFVTVTRAQQLIEYDHAIYIDATSGTNASVYPFGIEANPVNSWSNAKVLAEFYGFREIRFKGPLTLDADAEGYIFTGGGLLDTLFTSNYSIANSTFISMNMGGSGTGNISCDSVNLLNGITELSGVFSLCAFNEQLSIAHNSSANFLRCFSGLPTGGSPQVNLGTNTQISLRDYDGKVLISGSTTGCNTSLDFTSGSCVIDNTNTGGNISVAGITSTAFTDNSTGATVEMAGVFENENNSEILSDILEDTNELNTTINYSESDEVFDETASNEL